MKKPSIPEIDFVALEEKRDSALGKLAKIIAILATILLVVAVFLALSNTPYKVYAQNYIAVYLLFIFITAFMAFKKWKEEHAGEAIMGWLVLLSIGSFAAGAVGGLYAGLVFLVGVPILVVILKALGAKALKSIRKGE